MMKMLRMMTLLLLPMLLSTGALSQDMIEGEGRFQSTQEDSLTFVRGQLLYQAFRDVMTKEMRALGLDAQAFWQKYEERFQASFESVRAELNEKHAISSGNANARQKLEFEKELRSRELNARSRFGNIARVIDSYSIKNMSRAAQSAQSRFLTLQARVNRRMLTSVYNEFMREGRGRYFSQIIITPSFQLREGAWADLGVQSEEDITSVVKQHWTQWFQNHLGRFVHRSQISDMTTEKKIDDYLRLSADIFSHESIDSNSEGTSVESEEMAVSSEQRDITATLSNSLWLKINLRFSKIRDNEVLQNRTLRYEGEMVLIDLKTKAVIHAQDFLPEEHTYSIEDMTALSSNVASFLYRMPVPEFEKLPRVLGQLDSRSQQLRLSLDNMRSIEDFYQFRDILVKRGVTEDFSPRLVEYSGVSALIDLHFKGERSVALERLRSMQNLRLTEEKSLELQSLERPLEFSVQHLLLPPPQVEEGSQKN